MVSNDLAVCFFDSCSQGINIWPFNLQTYCKTVVDIVYLDSSEKLSCRSKRPKHPSKIGGQKWTKADGVYVEP